MIGVVTVTGGTVGVATVTVDTGVLTATVAETVDDTVADKETPGTGRLDCGSDGDDVDIGAAAGVGLEDACVAVEPEPCVDGPAALVAGRLAVVKWRRAGPVVSAARDVPAAAATDRLATGAGNVAAASVPIGATTRAATTPVVARPAATTTAAVPFAAAS